MSFITTFNTIFFALAGLMVLHICCGGILTALARAGDRQAETMMYFFVSHAKVIMAIWVGLIAIAAVIDAHSTTTFIFLNIVIGIGNAAFHFWKEHKQSQNFLKDDGSGALVIQPYSKIN